MNNGGSLYKLYKRNDKVVELIDFPVDLNNLLTIAELFNYECNYTIYEQQEHYILHCVTKFCEVDIDEALASRLDEEIWELFDPFDLDTLMQHDDFVVKPEYYIFCEGFEELLESINTFIVEHRQRFYPYPFDDYTNLPEWSALRVYSIRKPACELFVKEIDVMTNDENSGLTEKEKSYLNQWVEAIMPKTVCLHNH